MPTLSLAALLVLLSSHGILFASSQSTEIVWSSVIVTRNGDSIPLISNDPTVITPLGAQQLFQAGSLFRDRYIAPKNSSGINYTIPGISQFLVDNSQTFALALLDEYVTASAQAFIQGLYPPLADTFGYNAPVLSPISLLANGSDIPYPLGGYQYPLIYATSQLDPNAIWLAGQVNCNGFIESGSQYFSTSEYSVLAAATNDFYQSVASSVFGGELPADEISYHNAYYIFDYINYGYTHNGTIQAAISPEQLFQFRTLADQWEFAINGNVSASGYDKGDRVRTIAGQTLAAEILGLFFNNVENGGSASKINLLFTTFDPMISLASLMGLPSLYTQFYGLPDLGSSMVFEMFSDANASVTSYPDPSNLYVRFLFRNGTNSSENLDLYPIFGNGENKMAMSLTDFTSAMENIMMSTVGEWCTICESDAVFCPGYINATTGGSPASPTSSPSSGMKAAIAGVIGAVVALIVAGLILALIMLLFGVRFHRSTAKRRSKLGGFKGSEKLASDADLTVIKGGAGASVVKTGPNQGHERVGSWELGEAGRGKDFGTLGPQGERRPSFEGDRDADGESVRGVDAKAAEAREVV